MSVSSIRKTEVPYKGGPGAVGIRFDPATKTLKVHDGSRERTVQEGSNGVTNLTADYTVTTADHGKVFTLNKVDGLVVTLPALSAANKGLTVTFVTKVLTTSNVYRISPAAADSIKFGTDNKGIENTAATDTLGDSVTLVSDGADTWIVTSQVGVWGKEA